MERDTGIIKERDYIVKTDRSPEESVLIRDDNESYYHQKTPFINALP